MAIEKNLWHKPLGDMSIQNTLNDWITWKNKLENIFPFVIFI